MPVYRFADMTWEEVRDADRATAVAILPVGAVEAHGPHLPLGTDVVIAEAMANACADVLAGQGLTALLMPPLWYTAAEFGRGFPGTVGVEADTVTALILEIARSLGEHEIGTLAIANAHLDPTHLASLRSAQAKAEPGCRVVWGRSDSPGGGRSAHGGVPDGSLSRGSVRRQHRPCRGTRALPVGSGRWTRREPRLAVGRDPRGR